MDDWEKLPEEEQMRAMNREYALARERRGVVEEAAMREDEFGCVRALELAQAYLGEFARRSPRRKTRAERAERLAKELLKEGRSRFVSQAEEAQLPPPALNYAACKAGLDAALEDAVFALAMSGEKELLLRALALFALGQRL